MTTSNDYIKAVGDPSGYSGHTDNTGTPLTNYEYYQRINDRSNDFH